MQGQQVLNGVPVGQQLSVPLKMRHELANSDLLRHLLVQVLTVEHHRLQDGQRSLQHCRVCGRLAHKTCNLQWKGRQERFKSRSQENSQEKAEAV